MFVVLRKKKVSLKGFVTFEYILISLWKLIFFYKQKVLKLFYSIFLNFDINLKVYLYLVNKPCKNVWLQVLLVFLNHNFTMWIFEEV